MNIRYILRPSNESVRYRDNGTSPCNELDVYAFAHTHVTRGCVVCVMFTTCKTSKFRDDEEEKTTFEMGFLGNDI